MSRGRKPTKIAFGKDWKELFKSSIGYYFQSIIVELASQSISKNSVESRPKLKPKNVLPKIEESEKPFEIPTSWNWYRLGELCNYGSSSKAEPKNLNDSTWVLDLEDIEKETSVLLAKVRFAERNSLSTKSIFKKGDVLYSKLRPYLDKVIVADEDGVCTTEILPLSFPEEINPNFLLLTLKLRSFLNYVNGVTKGMKMPRLGTKEGKMALIPVPSLSEQNKILNFLVDLENNSLKPDNCYFDKEIERKIINLHISQLKGFEISTELNNQLSLVKELRQAFLREAMQGKLVAQDEQDEPAEILLEKIKAEKSNRLLACSGDRLTARRTKDKPLPEITAEEIPFEIPGNWTWCRLGELIELISGQHIDTTDYNEKGEGYPYLTGPADFGDIYPNATKWTTKPKVFADKDDILITVKGSGVGKTNISNLDKVVISRQLMAIRTRFISRFFLHFFLDNSFELLQSEKKGTGIPGISRENILEKVFLLPPLAEQERIVEKLEKLMKYCDELEANILESKQQAEILLQVALKEALEPK